MNADLDTILRDLRQGMEALYGNRLDRLVLFGSRARGDAEPDSDIDVLVVLQDEPNISEEIARTSELRCALSLKYDTVVSFVYVASESWTSSGDLLLENVRTEGMPI